MLVFNLNGDLLGVAGMIFGSECVAQKTRTSLFLAGVLSTQFPKKPFQSHTSHPASCRKGHACVHLVYFTFVKPELIFRKHVQPRHSVVLTSSGCNQLGRSRLMLTNFGRYAVIQPLHFPLDRRAPLVSSERVSTKMMAQATGRIF
jgi:hypothetical protein